MEHWISVILQLVDPVLIRLFLLTSDPIVNFFMGSFVLAFGCVVVGEVTLSTAIRCNRCHIDHLKQEIRNLEYQSIQAHEMGDHESYRALNRAANDAWGRHFFTMSAYSAGVLWPVPFALGWMQIHFSGVNFPIAFPLSMLVGGNVGFAFSFIPIYILCRVLFKHLHPFLPYFNGVHHMLNAAHSPTPVLPADHGPSIRSGLQHSPPPFAPRLK